MQALASWVRGQSEINLELLAANDCPFKHHLDRTKYLERFSEDANARVHS